ncbi:MAG: maltose ABC transporter substrate-binding protein [Acidimicrobiia bacterium]|nr:maltose ABC transporter substrate-binding protein [Acidimicrobiia bacterium]MDX2466574.1 maltose ABC transporter substrate-binding protein [Acidimicrobiia bacterium]
MKNWKPFLGLLLAFALVLTACGDDGAEETTAAPAETTAAPTTAAPTTTEAPAETTTTEAPPAEETTTTLPPVVRADADLVIWADDTRTPAIQGFADQFGADNGITVAVQELGFGDIRDRLVVAGPTGEGPDIIIGAHDWLGELVTSGVVAPLDLSAVEGDFSEASISAFNYEGQTYGLPYAVENIALIRNIDLVPDAPATFEELEEIALGLVEDGTVEIPLALQENGNGDPFHNYPLFTALGGYVFGLNADGSYNPEDLGLDSAGGLVAAQAFADWAESGLIDVDITYDIMTESFGAGNAPFAITGPWALPSFEGVNFVVEPIPSVAGGDPRPFIAVQGFMVSAFAENPLFAQTFVLDLMATQEAQEAIFAADPRPPAHSAAFDTVAASDANIQGFGLSGQNGYPMPAIPAMGAVWSAWTDAYQLILTGSDAVQSFTDAADQIRTLIAEG